MVVVWCARRPAGRPGGVGDGGGASTQHGKARGGRGARWFTAALPWPHRSSRERARERAKEGRVMSRGSRRSTWRRLERPASRGRGRQAGWWRGELGGVAVSVLCLLAGRR